MNTAKLLILLLDDDEFIRNTAVRSLKRAGMEVMAPELRPQPVLAALQKKPTAILVDNNMGNMTALEFFNWLRREVNADWGIAPIWMVTGQDDPPLAAMRKAYPNVRPQILRKPVDASDLLAIMAREEVQFRLPPELEHLPFPLRVLDPQGRVVHRSPSWFSQADNRPSPTFYLPFSANQIPKPHEFFSPRPLGEGEKGGQNEGGLFYRLHSFPIMLGKYLAQMAEPLQSADTTPTWHGMVDQLFEVMQESGFHRGRFYRLIPVHGSSGLLRLEMATGGLKGGHTLPIEYPLSEALNQRFTEFGEKQTPKNKKLIYQIRAKSDDMDDDPAIRFWDGVVEGTKLKSWLEVPLLTRRGDGRCFTSGLFIFDRLGSKGLADGDPREVQEKHVHPVKATLVHLVRQIGQLLGQEEERQEHKRLQTLTTLDQRLFREVRREAIEKALLQAAVEITGAAGGLLITREGAAETLVVRSAMGAVQEDCLLGAHFLLSETFHPVVQCWQSGAPVFLPDYRKSKQRTGILDYLQAHRLSKCEPERLRNWLSEGIGALAAMPILSGEEKVGAISLQHGEAYHFRHYHIQALEGLLQRARWFLHAARQEDARTHWERAMVHEVRTEVAPILHGLDEWHHGYATPEEIQAKIHRHALRLSDLTQNFLETHPASAKVKQGCFANPGEAVMEFVELMEEIRRTCRLTLEIAPPFGDARWQTSLRGDVQYFARVVRNLLDNAHKFCPNDGHLLIALEVDGDAHLWRLIIRNSGAMSPDANQHKFHSGYMEHQKNRTGAHMGLAASQGCVQAIGGDLTLENVEDEDGEQVVEARLSWPMVSSSAQIPGGQCDSYG